MPERDKKFLWPPADQWITVWWHFPVIAVVILILGFSAFVNLSFTRWACVFASGLTLSLLGAALIFRAKLPLYREQQFFTFGSKALPDSSKLFYKWGYRCFVVGVVVLLGLVLLSNH